MRNRPICSSWVRATRRTAAERSGAQRPCAATGQRPGSLHPAAREDLLAVIEQVGHGNYAEIRQTGSDNQASISQYGAYNDARIEQVGDGLRSTVTQYGYGQQINIVQGR